MTTLQGWIVLVEEVNGRTALGMDGIRDPDAPCEHYSNGHPTLAGIGLSWVSTRETWGDCNTDGHYLCVECPHMSRRAAIVRGLLLEEE